MKHIQRLLIFFLFISMAWGLMFGLFLGLYIGITNGIIYGLGGGFVFGFLLTIFGFLYDYFFRIRVFKKYGKRTFDVVQTKEITLIGNIKDILQKSVDALKMIKNVKKINPNYDANEIIATRGTTWKTYGENIKVRVNQEESKVRVIIQSRPRFKTAIFDGGRNIENVEIFCSLLRELNT